ncbi:hypothetical protein ACX1M6_01855 [Mycoplasma sp. VS1572C]
MGIEITLYAIHKIQYFSDKKKNDVNNKNNISYVVIFIFSTMESYSKYETKLRGNYCDIYEAYENKIKYYSSIFSFHLIPRSIIIIFGISDY